MTGAAKRGTGAKHPWLQSAHPPPEFDIRRRVDATGKRPFETEAKAEHRRKPWISALDNGGEGHRGVLRQLRVCYDDEPCALPFDPVCAQTWGINYVWRSSEAIAGLDADLPRVMATLTPALGQVAPGNLATFSIERHRNLLKTHLLRAGLGHIFGIGGVDISFNQDAGQRFDDYWQFHDHIVFIGAEKDDIKAGLRRFYPKTETIPTPIKTKPVTDLLGALSYTYKAGFFRRVSIIDGRGHRNTLPGRMPILAPQLRELAEYLSILTFSDRLILRGFRRRGAGLVPTAKGD